MARGHRVARGPAKNSWPKGRDLVSNADQHTPPDSQGTNDQSIGNLLQTHPELLNTRLSKSDSSDLVITVASDKKTWVVQDLHGNVKAKKCSPHEDQSWVRQCNRPECDEVGERVVTPAPSELERAINTSATDAYEEAASLAHATQHGEVEAKNKRKKNTQRPNDQPRVKDESPAKRQRVSSQEHDLDSTDESDFDESDEEMEDFAGISFQSRAIHPCEINDDFYDEIFIGLQQKGLKQVLKYWIKTCHKSKQASHPYNGGKLAKTHSNYERDWEGRYSAPDYWPRQEGWNKKKEICSGCRHKEPDHLFKGERLILAKHLLYADQKYNDAKFPLKELKESTAQVTTQCSKDFQPNADTLLSSLYQAREAQIDYEEGKIDGTAHLHLSMPSPVPRVRRTRQTKRETPIKQQIDVPEKLINSVSLIDANLAAESPEQEVKMSPPGNDSNNASRLELITTPTTTYELSPTEHEHVRCQKLDTYDLPLLSTRGREITAGDALKDQDYQHPTMIQTPPLPPLLRAPQTAHHGLPEDGSSFQGMMQYSNSEPIYPLQTNTYVPGSQVNASKFASQIDSASHLAASMENSDTVNSLPQTFNPFDGQSYNVSTGNLNSGHNSLWSPRYYGALSPNVDFHNRSDHHLNFCERDGGSSLSHCNGNVTFAELGAIAKSFGPRQHLIHDQEERHFPPWSSGHQEAANSYQCSPQYQPANYDTTQQCFTSSQMPSATSSFTSISDTGY